MFGKTKDINETDDRVDATSAIDDFFGDEAAVAEAARLEQLHHRVTNVEQQIHSQFTSMAAYAQIAQEQIELVRSESQHATERSEQRVTSLIDRERNDRLTGGGATPEVTARLDALEAQVADVSANLKLCLSNQKALADAIIDLFQPEASTFAGVAVPGPAEMTAILPAPAAPLLGSASAPLLTESPVIDFDMFDAPDIATIVPMSAPPAPLLTDRPSEHGFASPMELTGPIAALSLD